MFVSSLTSPSRAETPETPLTRTNSSKLRRAETPLTPPQLTSGRASLGKSRPLKVPCRNRPPIQLVYSHRNLFRFLGLNL